MPWTKHNLTKRTYSSPDTQSGNPNVALAPPIAQVGRPETGLNHGEIGLNYNAVDPTLFLLDTNNNIREFKLNAGASEKLNWLLEAFTKVELEGGDFNIQANKNFYSVGGVSAYGFNENTGGGGEGGATTLGGLTNVANIADGTSNDDYLLFKPSGSDLWTPKKITDLSFGIDEKYLKNYLTENKYATQQWVNENLGSYVTISTTQTITGTKTFSSNIFAGNSLYTHGKTAIRDGKSGVGLANDGIYLTGASSSAPNSYAIFMRSGETANAGYIRSSSNVTGLYVWNRIGINSEPDESYNLRVGGSSFFSGLAYFSGGTVQIGNVNLIWDSANNALKVEKSDGTAANFYATGGVSAYGQSSISSGISGAEYLVDLLDVSVTSVSNGQVLTYNSASGRWVNQATQPVVTNLEELSDVAISSVTNNQYLRYNGTRWVNSALDLSGYVTTTSLTNTLSGYVTLTTAQTVSGAKVFSSNTRISRLGIGADANSSYLLYVAGLIRSASNIEANTALKSGGFVSTGTTIANARTAWNDGRTGGYLSSNGRLFLNGASGTPPGIYFQWDNTETVGSNIHANSYGIYTSGTTSPASCLSVGSTADANTSAYKLYVGGTSYVNGILTASSDIRSNGSVYSGGKTTQYGGVTGVLVASTGYITVTGDSTPLIRFNPLNVGAESNAQLICESTGFGLLSNSGDIPNHLRIGGRATAATSAYSLWANGAILASTTVVIGGESGIRLSYDSTNNALKVEKPNGTSANFYATGGVTAYGQGAGDGGSGGGSNYLHELLDVSLGTLTNGQVLTYNSTSGRWVNQATQSVITTLGGLTDVTISSPANNQYLRYNGTRWVNSALDLSGYVTLATAQNITGNKTFTYTQYFKSNVYVGDKTTQYVDPGILLGSTGYITISSATIPLLRFNPLNVGTGSSNIQILANQYGLGIYSNTGDIPNHLRIGAEATATTSSHGLYVVGTSYYVGLSLHSSGLVTGTRTGTVSETTTGTYISGTSGLIHQNPSGLVSRIVNSISNANVYDVFNVGTGFYVLNVTNSSDGSIATSYVFGSNTSARGACLYYGTTNTADLGTSSNYWRAFYVNTVNVTTLNTTNISASGSITGNTLTTSSIITSGGSIVSGTRGFASVPNGNGSLLTTTGNIYLSNATTNVAVYFQPSGMTAVTHYIQGQTDGLRLGPRVSIGANPNTAYTFYVSGTSYLSSTTTVGGEIRGTSGLYSGGKTQQYGGEQGVQVAASGYITITNATVPLVRFNNIAIGENSNAQLALSTYGFGLYSNSGDVPGHLRIGGAAVEVTSIHSLWANSSIATTSFVQFGSNSNSSSVRLMYDSANNAAYFIKADGSACNFYATGGVSAYGLGSSSTTTYTNSISATGTISATGNISSGAAISAATMSTTGATNFRYLGVNGSSTSYAAYINGVTWITGITTIGTTYNSSYRLHVGGTLHVTGNITSGGTISDKRLKNNLEEVKSPINILKGVGPLYHYSYTDRAMELCPTLEKKDYGLLYQNVYSALPGYTGNLEGTEYGTVKYDRFIPIMIASILENYQKYESLEERVDRLEKENKELKSRLKMS